MPTFPYKTHPLPHQRDALTKGANAEAFAYLMETGTGKTYVALINAAFLFLQGKITGMLVVAPAGVHVMWIKDQLPTHLPDCIRYETFYWDSGRAATRTFERELDAFLASAAPFTVFAVNVDALRTKAYKAVVRYVKSRRCMGVLDESSDIKSPSSARGRKARLLRKFLPYRRILDATPMETPFDLYGQYAFLDPRIIGAPTFKVMKERYAEWEQVPLRGHAGAEARSFSKLVKYTNLDDLARRIAPYTFRCGKPPLPEKSFLKHYFALSAEARTVYEELMAEYTANLPGGHEVEVALKMVRMLRGQQVTCGYLPKSAITWSAGEPFTEPEYVIPGHNARITALLYLLGKYDGPTIIWCKFNYDARLITQALEQAGYTSFGVYEKYEDGEAFQMGEIDILISKVKSGGRGHTWTRARYVITYSQEFSWTRVYQAQDRVHRIGLTHPVLYIDLIADRTDDEHIVKVRERKQDLANIVMEAL